MTHEDSPTDMSPTTIAELFRLMWSMTPNQREQILSMIRNLGMEKAVSRPLSFSWAGGLKKLKDQYTSLELESKASEWR